MSDLWRMDPTSRFDGLAHDYHRFRPGYPDALFDRLLRDEPRTAADLGAGTGISACAMADRGVRVMAVEPNATMRHAAQPHPGVMWVEGTAESTGIEQGSMELVTAFQAFHWFDPEPAITEMIRILQPGRRIAAIWNERNERDEFTRTYGELVRRISNHHPAEARVEAAAALEKDQRLSNYEATIFESAQPMDLEHLLGRTRSISYLPKVGPLAATLREELETLFETWQDHDGLVRLVYRTSLHEATSPF